MENIDTGSLAAYNFLKSLQHLAERIKDICDQQVFRELIHGQYNEPQSVKKNSVR